MVDHTTESGLYIWKDDSGVWSIRAVGGGVKTYFEGVITSDLPLVDVTGNNFEGNDILEAANPVSVLFGMTVIGAGTDTISFTVPEGAIVSVDLTGNSDAGAESIRVGGDKWPVSNVPLDLSGW